MISEIRALIIEPDGAMHVEQVPTGYPTLNNALFDGDLVQVLYGRERDSGERVAVLFDEEGKYKNLEPNAEATLIWQAFLCDGARLMPGDYLAGRVAVCGLSNNGFADVPESVCPVQKLNTHEMKEQ